MFVFNAKDARRLAKALTRALARKGLEPALGQVLDGLAQAEGFADWNAWSASFTQAEIDAGLHAFELAHIEGTAGDEYGVECRLVTHTGFELRYAAHGELCEYVRVCDPLGRECMYWHADEFREDAEVVLGAVLGALARGKPLTTEGRQKAPLQAPRAPVIADVDFHCLHAVAFGGQYHTVEWREDAVLRLLNQPGSEEFEDMKEATALTLHYEQDGFVNEASLTLEQLAQLTWSAQHKAFVDSTGAPYELHMSYRFGHAPT